MFPINQPLLFLAILYYLFTTYKSICLSAEAIRCGEKRESITAIFVLPALTGFDENAIRRNIVTIYSCVKCIFRSKVTKEMTVFPEFLGNWEEKAKEDLQDLLDLPAHRLKENIFQFQDRRALPDLLVRPACL